MIDIFTPSPPISETACGNVGRFVFLRVNGRKYNPEAMRDSAVYAAARNVMPFRRDSGMSGVFAAHNIRVKQKNECLDKMRRIVYYKLKHPHPLGVYSKTQMIRRINAG